ncbi:MAG: SDR family oxidoreductase [Chloroflexi bacterium]|nr:SDR family oxidoreductase [Chloroflexota bacterium]
MDLTGKVAIVTGGGTGIGKAISRALAAAGAHVAVNYSRSGTDAATTVRELEGLGVRATAIRANVSLADEVRLMIERTTDELGGLDLLVNNAGTTKFVDFKDLDNMDEEAWDRIMAVNLKGTFLCCKAAAEPMRRAGGGSIVNISSVAGVRAAGSSIAYAVSKAGVIHLTRCMALALAPDIRVNSVAPGLVLTRWQDHMSAEERRGRAEAAPLKRTVEPEEIATAAVECLRNDAMTGQTIVVDAGSLL